MATPPFTQLDPGQVIKQSYDESKRSIRVDAQISSPDGTSVLIDATTDSIKIGNTATGPFLNINPDGSLNVNGIVSGTFSPSGLKNAGKVTTMTVNTTAIPLPATPLTARNAIAISNLSNAATLYVGFSNTITADRTIGTNAGWEVGPLEGFNLDVTDAITVYGISTGLITIKVMELS